jgi:putative membrane protein
MKTVQVFFVALVAFLHIYFMILEMFYWTKPKGLRAFGITKVFAEQSKTLAANQGLYNGFLAAGLIWSLINKNFSNQIALFFLSCVVLAGIYGAFSTKKIKLFYIQSIPAIIGIILTLLLKESIINYITI